MGKTLVHVLHTGQVCVAPALPYGGEHCNVVKASGLLGKKSDRLWLPVSAYLIECAHGRVLFDCGWHRNMSPRGEYDRKAQIASLGSVALYEMNQGVLPPGEAVDEQLDAKGISPRDLDLVLVSHLDCDHVNGLGLVAAARRILVSRRELAYAARNTPVNMIRYQAKWWDGTRIEGFDWNGEEGPVGRSFDVFGDGSLTMINIPGHSDGLCALKVRNAEGRFVLLFADGGYSSRSWKELVLPGITADKTAAKKSLEWIREQSLDPRCVESLANHDADVAPHTIVL